VRISPHFRKRHVQQGGYVLAVIIIMLLLALMALTAAAPYVVTQIKRDREEELIHRGRAYSTAVKRFMKKFGRYPTTLKELENTGNTRFIRKLYTDPVSKTGDWRLIHFGEAKYFPKGFGYNAISGMGGGTGGAILPGGMANVIGMGGSSPIGGQGNQPIVGQGAQSSQTNQGSSGGMTPASDISKPLSGGPTFGGGPIIGVASTNKAESIHEVNERKHYDEWEFFYDPRFDIVTQLNIGGAVPAGQVGQPSSGPGGPQRK
jgi:type II secretory pathway pseudopilin PulG